MGMEPEESSTSPGVEPLDEVRLSAIDELQAVAAEARQRRPAAKGLRHDVIAGLTATMATLPEAMALGLLVGVNPMYGLYASTVGPIVGGLAASTRLMVITNTGAASLAAGQALEAIPSGQRDNHLFLMVILAGLFAVLLGLLKLGRITRFVSYSVMTGFLAGIAVVLILSQLSTVLGFEGEGANRLAQTFDLLTRLDETDLETFGLAVLTIGLTALLHRTRLRPFGGLAGIVAPTLLVVLLRLDDVKTVRDVGTIPSGVPMPILPNFADSLDVLTGALSVAAIVLVQGAGVSQSVPNPDGSRSLASRDFMAQGVANIAAGFFRGLPVGGSLSATALSVSTGARDRWATVCAGLWMGLIVIALAGLAARVAMPALAGLLIFAGLQIIKPKDIGSVWRAGWASRAAGAATFVATLVLPIQAAVGLGVLISTVLYVNSASANITIVERVTRDDGSIVEREPPKRLPKDRVVVLDVYGQLFYGGGRTLERLLPQPGRDCEHPVVVLRLRGRTSLGATLEEVLSKYADKLEAVNGRLYLTGLNEKAYEEVTHMTKLRLEGPVRAYEVTPVIGESTEGARADAQAWLVSLKSR